MIALRSLITILGIAWQTWAVNPSLLANISDSSGALAASDRFAFSLGGGYSARGHLIANSQRGDLDWDIDETPYIIQQANRFFTARSIRTEGAVSRVYLGQLSQLTITLTWVLQGGPISRRDLLAILAGIFNFFAQRGALDKKAFEIEVSSGASTRLQYSVEKQPASPRTVKSVDGGLILKANEYDSRPIPANDMKDVLNQAISALAELSTIPDKYSVWFASNNIALYLLFNEDSVSSATPVELKQIFEALQGDLSRTADDHSLSPSIYGFLQTSRVVGRVQIGVTSSNPCIGLYAAPSDGELNRTRDDTAGTARESPTELVEV